MLLIAYRSLNPTETPLTRATTTTSTTGAGGVVALQGAVAAHAEVLRALDAEPVEVRSPEQLSGVDAVVLPGGESTTMSLLLESSGLFDPLAERLRDGMPALGTCAGMILLATE